MTASASRKERRSVAPPPSAKVERRRSAIVFGLFLMLGAPVAFIARHKPLPRTGGFQLIDITGAGYARDLELLDQNGVVRSLENFRGDVVVVLFGSTQCLEACPAALRELAQAKKLLGVEGTRLRGIFVTADPERDTAEVLTAYMASFDPAFVALRPTLEQLNGVAAEFKIEVRRRPGASPSSYTIDHTAASFVYDPQGRPRLYARSQPGAAALASDARLLLRGA